MSRSPLTIEGNVTGDVRVHTFNDGSRVANFTVAVNSEKKNKDTNKYEKVGAQFFDCVVPNHLVDAVLMNVSKGVPVVVSGTLDFRDWTSRDGSSTGTALEIRVERIGYSIRWHDVQGMKRQRGGGGGGSYYGQPQAGQAQSEWGQPAVQQQAPPQANWGQPAAPPATQGNPWANTPPAPPAQQQQQQFGTAFDNEQPF